MTNLKYSEDSGGELPEGQSHEDAAEALADDEETLVGIKDQAPAFSPYEELNDSHAERLIGEIEAAESTPGEAVPESGAAGGHDSGGRLLTAEDRQPPGDPGGRLGPGPEASPAFAKPAGELQWILPSILVVLTFGLAIFFLVNFSGFGDYPLGATGAGVPERVSRGELALHSTTRSKLAELNRQVIFWMSRNEDGFDPRDLTLKRVREDLDLSSDQMLDSWGRPIRYEAADGGYTLRSAGPDKTFNTDDDLVELQPQ